MPEEAADNFFQGMMKVDNPEAVLAIITTEGRAAAVAAICTGLMVSSFAAGLTVAAINASAYLDYTAQQNDLIDAYYSSSSGFLVVDSMVIITNRNGIIYTDRYVDYYRATDINAAPGGSFEQGVYHIGS
ncbi:MAG: hypothetical protein LBG99_09030 [Propionibacteriaceae bacterium]|nr:hypothetical protein [Propionibacteriaceae bacterium]